MTVNEQLQSTYVRLNAPEPRRDANTPRGLTPDALIDAECHEVRFGLLAALVATGEIIQISSGRYLSTQHMLSDTKREIAIAPGQSSTQLARVLGTSYAAMRRILAMLVARDEVDVHTRRGGPVEVRVVYLPKNPAAPAAAPKDA